MSYAAHSLLRDIDDLRFARAHGFAAWMCEEYEYAIRYTAGRLIGAGC